MKQPPIILIINKKPYTLKAGDTEAISNIPKADRQQLITLLEAIKRLESPEPSVAQQVAAQINTSTQTSAISPNVGNMPDMRTERLRSGDVEAVMAQLIMEEKQQQKPGLTKHSIYKWMGGTVAIIFLLILIL